MGPHRFPAISLAVLLAVCVFVKPMSAAAGSPVVLAWDASPYPGILGYKVYRTENPTSFASPPLNGSTLIPSTSFTDSTAQGNRTYYYAVTAVASNGLESTRSNTVQVITISAPTNLPPIVDAGPGPTITLPSSANLAATATDDGLPGPLTYRWSVVQGSGVSIASPTAIATQAS